MRRREMRRREEKRGEEGRIVSIMVFGKHRREGEGEEEKKGGPSSRCFSMSQVV